MTSPPSPETGPTPEEQALIAWADQWPGTFEGFTLGAWDALVIVLREAKRSAHLEDARAVCVPCRRGASVERSMRGLWHHKIPDFVEPAGPSAWTLCLAGPIWDALSRTGGGR